MTLKKIGPKILRKIIGPIRLYRTFWSSPGLVYCHNVRYLLAGLEKMGMNVHGMLLQFRI